MTHSLVISAQAALSVLRQIFYLVVCRLSGRNMDHTPGPAGQFGGRNTAAFVRTRCDHCASVPNNSADVAWVLIAVAASSISLRIS